MSNDFESAQVQWLKAAELSDPRAMFNLGLLHERQRIPGANQGRADQWFTLAGEAGYAPADYHLAQRLKSRGLTMDANVLLKRAAGAGFLLAQEELGINPLAVESSQSPLESQFGAEPSVQQQDSSPNESSSSLSTAVRYQGERWVLVQPADAWTIQMLAFSEEAKVRNFIDDHALHRNAAYFLDNSQAVPLYKLIYGSYASKQEADDARAGLTSMLREHGPWLRPIKAVQAIINDG